MFSEKTPPWNGESEGPIIVACHVVKSSPTGPALQLEGGSFVKSNSSLLIRFSAMSDLLSAATQRRHGHGSTVQGETGEGREKTRKIVGQGAPCKASANRPHACGMGWQSHNTAAAAKQGGGTHERGNERRGGNWGRRDRLEGRRPFYVPKTSPGREAMRGQRAKKMKKGEGEGDPPSYPTG
jgi:hypothetical protein